MNYSLIIDRYLEGNLSQEELIRFELELEVNPALAVAVRKLKSLNDTILKYAPEMSSVDRRGINQDVEIKDEIDFDIDRYSNHSFPDNDQRKRDRLFIKKILEENRPRGKSKYILINRAWIIAACIFVLISIGSIFFIFIS